MRLGAVTGRQRPYRRLVRLALFDLDNTLADRDRAFQLWADLFCTRFRLGEEARPWLLEADGDGFIPRRKFLASAQSRFGLTASVEELLQWYASTYPACYTREEQSISALTELRGSGWSIGVVTNGRLNQQSDKMRRTGLDEVVDAVCVSEDLGVRKPDPRIFHEAARRCGLLLSGWMVGDSPEADIVGGVGVGLQTIWLTRHRQWPAKLTPPSRSVLTIQQAVEIILDAR